MENALKLEEYEFIMPRRRKRRSVCRMIDRDWSLIRALPVEILYDKMIQNFRIIPFF